jgi:hypothetical protein
MDRVGDAAHVLQRAEEVRHLQAQAGSVLVQLAKQVGQVRRQVLIAGHVQPHALRVGADDFAVFGVNRRREDDLAPLLPEGVERQDDRLGK